MRGCISESKLREISTKLPVLKASFLSATFPDFAVILDDIAKGTSLELALICLNDAYTRCGYCNLALHEAFASLTWYREESPQAPQEFEAVFAGKFYADYIPLILYAGGEDIADFIMYLLDMEADMQNFLDRPEIQKVLEDKRLSSNAGKVGLYMNSKHPGHEITRIISELRKNDDWQAAMRYRNAWVHEKSPIVDGLGIQFERKSQKELVAGWWRFPVGAGSKPKYDIDQLIELSYKATQAFATALNALVDIAEKHRPSEIRQ